jgi:glycerol transport system ATP-binding protein
MAKLPRNLAHSWPSKQQREDYAQNLWTTIGSTERLTLLLGSSGWQAAVYTLLNIISGLLHPSQGRILFNDKDVTMAPTTRRNIAQVSSFRGFDDADNLASPLRRV